jgi:hypothetical protein
MNLKPDKECEKRGDIVFLSEIIKNSMYWQEYQKNVKHFFLLFLRQQSPCPDCTGFFEVY